MDMDIADVLAILQLNPRQSWLEVTEVLVKVAGNILANPSESKFRRLKKANAQVRSKLIDLYGGLESLLYMGFVEEDVHFVLSQKTSMTQLRNLTERLRTLREGVLNNSVDVVPYASDSEDENDGPDEYIKEAEELRELLPTPPPADNKTTIVLLPNRPGINCRACERNVPHGHFPENVPRVIYPPMTYTCRNNFLRSIEQIFHTALAYKDPQLRVRAKRLIPKEKLERRAVKKMRLIQKQIKEGAAEDLDVTLQDFLIVELLDWFKNEFFTWVDNPTCTYCGGKTDFYHMSDDPAMLINTSRVEMHKCSVCDELTPFPRYNDPNFLLITRQGRCGEWANAFTLMCNAMGWMTRIVYDQTDHVWTEVYLNASKRWVHCDACENAFDTPLMYETGWGKQLSYCIAYSSEDLQDVTWRYSSNHQDVLRRRYLCTEEELIDLLVNLRVLRQRSLTHSRQKYLTNLTLQELIELLIERNASEEEKHGRNSGSLEWRLSRGETTKAAYTWKISKEDAIAGPVTIYYSIASDKYIYVNAKGSKRTISKWHSAIFDATNMFRKEEKDWKMVYLARTENSDVGTISWRFTIEDEQHVFDEINVHFIHKLYEDGVADIVLIGDKASVKFPADATSVSTSALAGSKSVLLKATLTKGKGKLAWQHAQLFRDLNSSKDYQFSIMFKFK